MSIPPNFKDSISSRLKQITLELTERCNLRCKYCIYNDFYKHDRNFGYKNMNETIAFKSIDFLKQHSQNSESIALTFYGGEPLLKFDLIKKAVEYAKLKITDKNLTYSLTTNLTLVTEEIAEYLSSIENFSIVCSLDGPTSIHDQYRVYPDNKGSFADAINGLKLLVKAYGSRSEKLLSINMVFTPPFSFERLEEIQEFFNKLDWLPSKVEKRISYPVPESIPYALPAKAEVNHKISHLLDWTAQNYVHSIRKGFTDKIIQERLIRFHYRQITGTPEDTISLNGCCIPGVRKAYITTEGEIKICEKIRDEKYIGNIFNGYDLNMIENHYLKGFVNASLPDCKFCWAAKLCGLCYVHLFIDTEKNIAEKHRYCNIEKSSILNDLIYYHNLSERHPDLINSYNFFQLS